MKSLFSSTLSVMKHVLMQVKMCYIEFIWKKQSRRVLPFIISEVDRCLEVLNVVSMYEKKKACAHTNKAHMVQSRAMSPPPLFFCYLQLLLLSIFIAFYSLYVRSALMPLVSLLFLCAIKACTTSTNCSRKKMMLMKTMECQNVLQCHIVRVLLALGTSCSYSIMGNRLKNVNCIS